MTAPAIQVLGVYRVSITDQLVEEQARILFGDSLAGTARGEALAESRRQLSSVVLIEAVVRNRDATFSVSDFAQADDGEPEENWQAAWAEAYLTEDGQGLAVERWSTPPATGDLRVAFFMHCWQHEKLLRSTYGDVACPAPSEMPLRLEALVPYEVPD